MKDFDILKNLCDTKGLTEYDERNFVISYLSSLGYSASSDVTGNVIAGINGKSDYNILVDAHLDKIGFSVVGICDNGFLKCCPHSGIDMRVVSSQEVVVYGKEPLLGVISCTPPHLAKGEDKPIDKDNLFVDVGLCKESAQQKVNIGDFVCFKSEVKPLANRRVTASALDDRAGVLCLLKLAQKLHDAESDIPVGVTLLFSNFEELGLRGAKTAAFSQFPNEAISVDVSFGKDAYIKSHEGGSLDAGAMIGVSPILNKQITEKLYKIAKQNDIKYQTEAMAGTTGTNADSISVAKSGVRTGLISIPLRNMHTACEIISLNDTDAVTDLLFNYVMDGGIKNA